MLFQKDTTERFKVLQKLGEGTFSVVYRCTDRERTGADVAVKVIKRLDTVTIDEPLDMPSDTEDIDDRPIVDSPLVVKRFKRSDSTEGTQTLKDDGTEWTSWKINEHPQLENPLVEESDVDTDDSQDGNSQPITKPLSNKVSNLLNADPVTVKATYSFLPTSVLREVLVLSYLAPHPHIITLREVVMPEERCVQKQEVVPTSPNHNPPSKTTVDPSALCLIFEYMPDGDLRHFLNANPHSFTQKTVKRLFHQLLLSVAHLHRSGVLHRDIKPHNIVYNRQENKIKLTDFNLATLVMNDHISWPDSLRSPLTNTVVTLWYRSPEVLLGSTTYDFGIDTWALGCVLWEMAHPKERALFSGSNEVEQIMHIFQLLGTPVDAFTKNVKRAKDDSFFSGRHHKIDLRTSRDSGAHSTLPCVGPATTMFSSTPGLEWTPYFTSQFPKWQGAENLERYSPGLSPRGAHLLRQFLEVDPRKRITAMAALSHPWFFED